MNARPATTPSFPAKPMISIVTPSLNQGRFLERAMNSVLGQATGNVEYLVVDGGSTDGSVDLIRRYAPRLAWWCSEPDQGQYDALNKGFARSTGEIMAWLNADDLYLPWTLALVSEIFAELPSVQWLTTLSPMTVRDDGTPTGLKPLSRMPHRNAFLRGEFRAGPGKAGFLMQEATFWRRSLWDKAGGTFDTQFRLAGDFDLWARFFQFAEVTPLSVPLAGFGYHGKNQSVVNADLYAREADHILKRYGNRPYSAWGRFWRTSLAPAMTSLPSVLRAWNAWYPVCYLKPATDTSLPRWRLASKLQHL